MWCVQKESAVCLNESNDSLEVVEDGLLFVFRVFELVDWPASQERQRPDDVTGRHVCQVIGKSLKDHGELTTILFVGGVIQFLRHEGHVVWIINILRATNHKYPFIRLKQCHVLRYLEYSNTIKSRKIM